MYLIMLIRFSKGSVIESTCAGDRTAEDLAEFDHLSGRDDLYKL